MRTSRYLFVCLFAACSMATTAQNIDPTVNVTKTYEGKLVEIAKPSVGMEVPDSVMKFNLDFEYSVNNNPFKGAYEFIPYLQDIKPVDKEGKLPQLMLRLGAGYGLHPEFDLVWSPRFKKDFKMSVYATHRSYFGKYHSITYKDFKLVKDGASYRGWDAYSNAGVDGRYDYRGGSFTFGVSYTALNTRNKLLERNSNGLDVSARARSVMDQKGYLYYDVAMDYSFMSEKVNGGLSSHAFAFDATLGPVFNFDHAVLLDVNIDVASYSGFLNSAAADISLVPQYRYRDGRWDVKAGLNIEFLSRPKNAPREGMTLMNIRKGQVVYPDVKVSFAALPDFLNIYAKVKGGADINPYKSLLAQNHWLNPSWATGAAKVYSSLYGGGGFADNTIERVNASLGFEGNIAHLVSFDVFGGYAVYGNMPLDAVALYDEVSGDALSAPLSAVAYSACNMAYVGLKADMSMEMLDVHADLLYRWSNVNKKRTFGFELSPFTGDIMARYNWRHKVYAQVVCEWAVARRGHVLSKLDSDGPHVAPVTVPGWADLSLGVSYSALPWLNVWAKGGNLAAMTIQRTPLYAEKGANFTLGITLNI